MIYGQLKAFCNGLTEEQLRQGVYLSITDGEAIAIEHAGITEHDQYFEHCDPLGTLEEIKIEEPENWEDVIADATVLPKGSVYLSNELPNDVITEVARTNTGDEVL